LCPNARGHCHWQFGVVLLDMLPPLIFFIVILFQGPSVFTGWYPFPPPPSISPEVFPQPFFLSWPRFTQTSCGTPLGRFPPRLPPGPFGRCPFFAGKKLPRVFPPPTNSQLFFHVRSFLFFFRPVLATFPPPQSNLSSFFPPPFPPLCFFIRFAFAWLRDVRSQIPPLAFFLP